MRRCIVNGASSRRDSRPRLGETGDVQEDFVDVGADGAVGRQQSEIRVLPRGAEVVIAGAEVRILDELAPTLPIRSRVASAMRASHEP